MNWIIELLGILIMSYVLSDLSNFIGTLIGEIGLKKRGLKILQSTFVYVLTCPKCFTFWFSLCLSGSLLWACIAAALINIIKKIEYKIIGGETEL